MWSYRILLHLRFLGSSTTASVASISTFGSIFEFIPDTEPENEFDDEFQICNFCSMEEERKKLLQCTSCRQLVHHACTIPPVEEVIYGDWYCHSCKEKSEEYLRAKHTYHEEMMKRYEGAMERKLKILEIIRSLDLPNNPLDDIIDQLGGPDNVA